MHSRLTVHNEVNANGEAVTKLSRTSPTFLEHTFPGIVGVTRVYTIQPRYTQTWSNTGKCTVSSAYGTIFFCVLGFSVRNDEARSNGSFVYLVYNNCETRWIKNMWRSRFYSGKFNFGNDWDDPNDQFIGSRHSYSLFPGFCMHFHFSDTRFIVSSFNIHVTCNLRIFHLVIFFFFLWLFSCHIKSNIFSPLSVDR